MKKLLMYLTCLIFMLPMKLYGSDIDTKNSRDRTPLLQCAMDNNIPKFKKLLADGADPEIPSTLFVTGDEYNRMHEHKVTVDEYLRRCLRVSSCDTIPCKNPEEMIHLLNIRRSLMSCIPFLDKWEKLSPKERLALLNPKNEFPT